MRLRPDTAPAAPPAEPGVPDAEPAPRPDRPAVRTHRSRRPRRASRRRRFAAVARQAAPSSAVAAAGGLALAAAFPPYDLWPLSMVAVAALSLLTRGRTVRQGAWLGFAFGWPFFLWLLQWLHTRRLGRRGGPGR